MNSPVSSVTVPSQFLLAGYAPRPRTLWDVVQTTAELHPDAAAIDDGEVLTYAELIADVRAWAKELHRQGVSRGDHIGIRMSSGQRELYLAILSIMAAGAAYVPVDVDDPDERADMVFGEADINGVFTDDGFHMIRKSGGEQAEPRPEDTAWIIFTSGSTGKPKGVAVSHRSAAAFVDAEAALFLIHHPAGPLGPDDRVLAGLSVAFDASCEEMWLAWGHGACLVPAPRSLVRSGMDLGPWLIRRDITVVSTVPTLAGLWPAEALDNIRLLIVGGEACSEELVRRLATDDREMWNTYGPTEATVVASAEKMEAGKPVSIGLPLNGWDLAVIDESGNPVGIGEPGELVIGGVGLARYLDPEKDAEKYAPLESLGWERAYRTGDHVRLEEDGLYFVGRKDDQVKIGGRRIELGEVEANVAALPNVYNSAVAVQKTGAGESVLVAYVSLDRADDGFDHDGARERLADTMPAALVPRIHVMDELPIRTSGKVDKKALPWPLPTADAGLGADAGALTPTEEWLAELWSDVLGVSIPDANVDFFSLGGTSLAAATLIGRIRERYPTVAVRELYDYPRLGQLAQHLAGDEEPRRASSRAGAKNAQSGKAGKSGKPGKSGSAASASAPHARATARPKRRVKPVSVGTRAAQFAIQLVAMTLSGATWLAWTMLGINMAAAAGVPWAPHQPWWLVIAFIIIFATPLGRIPIGGFGARAITAGITPGDYPRGGATHLRIWAAERWTDASGARSISGATWVNNYARTLGVRMGKGVDLHSLPPVTGLLKLGKHAAVEPEVDLSGYWLDGDVLHVGAIEIGKNSRIGARSTLLPGANIGSDAHVKSGSTVTGAKKVKSGQRWSGSPAKKVGRSKHRFPDAHPARRPWWVPFYGLTSLAFALLPVAALAVGAALTVFLVERTGGNAFAGALAFAPLGALMAFATYTALTWLGVRVFSLGLKPGVNPVRSAAGWRLWAVFRLMDDARTQLFPMYAGLITPVWLRALGAKVGRDVEASTAVMVPKFTDIKDGSFLADDAMVGGYELGGGWVRSGKARVGKRSFLGNSGVLTPGRKLSKNSLVAVLSSTPKKNKPESNWWGAPPERMRRVASDSVRGGDAASAAASAAEARTYQPGAGLKVARGVIETLRLFAPIASGIVFAFVIATLVYLTAALGPWLAWALSGLVLMAAGAIAVGVTVVAKWVCVGKHRRGEHPLWSPFVWLNELQDTFVECVAAPWFFNHNAGTGAMNTALRLLGARIGRGAWVDSYWLPEADLCHIGRGATVGPGTVVQTHLFQDRVMSLDAVTLGDGATLAAHSVALPAARIAESTTIEPGSLVMRGDQVPAHSVWQGNPIEPRGFTG